MTSKMSMRPVGVPVDVQGLQERFERWRANKGGGPEPIPPELWEAAVRLCGTHGVSRVSQWLRLHHTTLKKRAAKISSPRSCRPKPNFVEWSLPAGSLPGISPAEYVVEVAGRDDAAQRIHVRGASVSEVAALARALRTDAVGG